MQYYRPGGNYFVGDCMPFFHEGVFRLFYLLDEGHHRALGGLGGHQWAQASSADLAHWTHHPLAIRLTEPHEASICTGSVFFHDGTYYAFYATRTRDGREYVSLAASRDGVQFEKQSPSLLATPPPGLSPAHFRDPVVFREGASGPFHMLVTAASETHPIQDRRGCLAHLVSTDLKNWAHREPFIFPGLPGAPECPDYFEWNGRHYLLFSNGGVARYRMSRSLLGPWTRPKVDTFDGPAARVMKTAAFTGARRIGVAWIGTRKGDAPDGAFQFAGNAVFREIIQHEDGTLGTKFPPEMIPSDGGAAARREPANVRLESPHGLSFLTIEKVPPRARIRMRIAAGPGAASFGCRLRAAGRFESGCDLNFSPYEGIVRLHDQMLTAVAGLDREFGLEIIVMDDIVDVCIADRRTIVNRCPNLDGDRMICYALNADVEFREIQVRALR